MKEREGRNRGLDGVWSSENGRRAARKGSDWEGGTEGGTEGEADLQRRTGTR